MSADTNPEAQILSRPRNVWRDDRRRNPAGLYVATLFLGLGIWWVASVLSGNSLIPTPLAVVFDFWEALQDGTLLENTWASLTRVVSGFTLGVLAAIPAGFLMGWYFVLRALGEPWVQFFRTIPPLGRVS